MNINSAHDAEVLGPFTLKNRWPGVQDEAMFF